MGKYNIKINPVPNPDFGTFEMDQPKVRDFINAAADSGGALVVNELGQLVLNADTMRLIYYLIQQNGKFDGKFWRDDQLDRLDLDFFTEVISEATGGMEAVSPSDSPSNPNQSPADPRE